MSTGTDTSINQYLLILLHLMAATFQIRHNKQQIHLLRHPWGSIFHVKMDNQRTSGISYTILQQRIDRTPKETNTHGSCVVDRLLIVKSFVVHVVQRGEISNFGRVLKICLNCHPQIFMINGLCEDLRTRADDNIDVNDNNY